MKKYVLTSCLVACALFLQSQTSLSGQINVYTQLISQDACTNTITVADASAYVPGMGIIIVQMKGANIDLSNSADYGNITDLNGAGQYEYNRITNITGNELMLEFTLINEYIGNSTQVIGFEIYENASVDNTIVPAPWDGTIGGVIAIQVNGTLTLNANIDASESGFRGGLPISIEDNNCNFLTNADDYAYSSTNWRGAPKGEGIGDANSSEPYGRGAQANGGGGGNDHNSGGGGGSLFTIGGQGGVNDEPSTFGCDGDFPGRGGKALPNLNTLAFAGGGGGSGHANNLELSAGGNGGGIIFIKAETINFTGGNIINNGGNAPPVTGDGGGGGGAGGSIFLIATSATGNVQIISQGGIGATVSNGEIDRCFGPGGGGSGGVLWSNLSLTPDLAGGVSGVSNNSTVCDDATNGAQNGNTGLTGTLSDWQMGTLFASPTVTLSGNDTTVCAGILLELEATITGDNLVLQWQRLVDGTWSDLVEVPGNVTGTQTSTLQLQITEMLAGSYRLTLLPEGNCFSPLNSEPVEVSVIGQPLANPAFTANGVTVDFMANTVNGTQWEWIFLPDQSSEEENPTYTFPSPGTYQVMLIVTNICGQETYPLTVELSEPLVAQINSSSIEGCAPLTILFEDQSSGTVTSRLWTFPGGQPNESTAAAPVVTFMEPGTYEVTLDISNGNTEASTNLQIEVVAPPVPNFIVSTNDLMISLQNNSLNATDFLWNFGDDNTSTLENPVHTYASPGIYEVSLSASNGFCGVAIAQTVNVDITPNSELQSFPLQISPNPTNGQINIQHWNSGTLELYNSNGQYLQTWKQQQLTLNISHLPAGLYFLRYTEDTQRYWLKIIKL